MNVPDLKITEHGAPFTVINRFLPAQENQPELVRVLTEGISQEMALLPGFIAAAVHSSTDSADVLVYAQWDRPEDLAHAGEIVAAGKAPNMAKGFELGPPEYHPFEVRAIIPAVGQTVISS